ncbi:MAG: NRDE family protein [Cyclobacteriaceae bacterium]|nr:NRDE family protein [Cyclobacteriaceae bacterium]
MCLIFLSFQHHPAYKLIIAGNRDEFYERKTASANFWHDHPDILAGRDLEAGGTWMGISKSGNISMLTNYRDPRNIDPLAPSRGRLVSDFLTTQHTPEAYLQQLDRNGKAYNGFNLIVGSGDELWYYSNYKKGINKLSHGFYGISNHLLETPWPKVLRGKQKMETALKQSVIDPEQLFEILYDDKRAIDAELPDTGLPIERERALSSMFIKSDNYGSRCSTVILVDKSNNVLFSERVYDTTTFQFTTQTYSFAF